MIYTMGFLAVECCQLMQTSFVLITFVEKDGRCMQTQSPEQWTCWSFSVHDPHDQRQSSEGKLYWNRGATCSASCILLP